MMADVLERASLWRADGLAFLADVLTLPDNDRSYGHSLDGWQRADFGAAFAESAKHLWWERPRAHSKTMDAAALALHHLLATPGGRAYFAAVDKEQASLAFDSLRLFVLRSPLLRGSLTLGRWRVAAESTDSVLEVLSADAASSWGLRPSLLVLDELQAWRGEAAEEFFHALYSSLGKVKGARMIVATTAGWNRTSLCWKLRQQVESDPAWIFSRRGQCASWVLPDFLEQQRRLLPEHVYRRLHLNEWTEAGGAYLTYQEVEGIFSPLLSQERECNVGDHFLGVDVGLSGDATALVVVHRHDDATVDVHDVATWRGSRQERVPLSEVEDWIVDADRRFSGLRVVADPWQAIGLVQRLRERGVKAEDVTFGASYRDHLFRNLLELVRERRLRCYHHEGLKDELLNLEFREVGGNLRVDHPASGHDDHVVALAMASLGASSPPPKRGDIFWAGGPGPYRERDY